MEPTLFDITIRMILAAILGGVIGLERQVKGKVAGLRTTMLICTGAALFMIVSELIADRSGDRGRIAAQVVTGIGFLGAGAILHRGAGITGLTTAATIFAVAAIGLATGAGFYAPALITTIVVLFTLFPLGKLEFRIHTSYQTFHYSLNTTDVVKLMEEINDLLLQHRVSMEEIELTKRGEAYQISFNVTANPSVSHAVMRRMLATGTVASVTAPSSHPANDHLKEDHGP